MPGSGSTERLTGPFRPAGDSYYLQRLNQMYWALQDVQQGVGVPAPRQWDFPAVAGRHELGAGAFVGDPAVFVDGLLLARTWWTYTAGDSAIVITFVPPAGCVFSVVGMWRAE